MMHFRLVSAQGIKYDNEAYEVLVPTKGGTIAVFENHMPLISAASGGVVSIREKSSDSEMKHFAVSGGVMQVAGKDLIFLSDDITLPEDVNEKEAEAALERAEELVKNATSRSQINEAQRSLHHSRAQLNIARVKRRHHS
jgi:F-type H+-transporting ATPase subunit epsilon